MLSVSLIQNVSLLQMFELVYLWVEKEDESQYVKFINSLFEQITSIVLRDGNGGAPAETNDDEQLREEASSERAFCSCTHDLAVAVRFAASSTALLFLVNTRSFMRHGADLEFLSTAPWEREVCYPACTLFTPTGRTQEVEVQLNGRSCGCTIVEVEPEHPS